MLTHSHYLNFPHEPALRDLQPPKMQNLCSRRPCHHATYCGTGIYALLSAPATLGRPAAGRVRWTHATNCSHVTYVTNATPLSPLTPVREIPERILEPKAKIGRASCRERV